MPEQQNLEFKIELLESFINKIEIPNLKPRVKTFLGISKQPHYENVWSNIYAFFFNEEIAFSISSIPTFKPLSDSRIEDGRFMEFIFDALLINFLKINSSTSICVSIHSRPSYKEQSKLLLDSHPVMYILLFLSNELPSQ